GGEANATFHFFSGKPISASCFAILEPGKTMPEPTATQTLLQRVHAGDQGALNDLYNRYLMRVLAAVRARLGAELRGKLESWDIVQDALLASLRNVQSFNQTSEGAF